VGEVSCLLPIEQDFPPLEPFPSLTRSIHNTRIERTWYDVTRGFGQKWKNFFMDLEVHHGLNPTNESHIWLLHHLFLDAINKDANDWVQAWNSHTMQLRGQRNRSPRDMFMFGMVNNGPRGLSVPEPADDEDGLEDEDLALYGVDWQAAEQQGIMEQIMEQNPEDFQDGNPFSLNAPMTRNHVECQPPSGLFPPNYVNLLDEGLAARVDITSDDMDVRRLVWIEALHICNHFYALMNDT